MDTTTFSPAAIASTDTLPSERPLRVVLGLNAGFSGVSGVVLVAAAGPVADLIGVTRTWPVWAVGVALIVFALDVALVARLPRRWLVRGGWAILAADLAWLAATAAFLAAGVFSAAGSIAALVVAAAVAGFAAGEWRGLRVMR